MKYFFAVLLLTRTLAALGVETVDNDKKPSGPAYTMEFVEDLRLGGNTEDENLYWGGLSISVDADRKGHIYVIDPDESRILEFDAEGKWVRTLGGKGQGPGEYQNLNSFTLLGDGSAIGFESLGAVANFSYYDKDLKYLERKSSNDLSKIIGNVKFAPDGNNFAALFSSFTPGTPVLTIRTAVLNKSYEVLETVSETTMPLPDVSRFSESAYWTEYLAKGISSQMSGYGVFGFDPQSNIYVAHSRKYEISIWSADRKKLKTITKKFDPIPLTDEDMEAFIDPIRDRITSQIPTQVKSIITENLVRKAIEMAEIPPTQHPVQGILVMDDGGFLVVHDVKGNGTSTADIFSPKGEFLGKVTRPGNAFLDITSPFNKRMIFKNKYAYCIENDQDGENFMVRYKYKLVKK